MIVLYRCLLRQHRIELCIVELVVNKGVHKIIGTILRKLVNILVVGLQTVQAAAQKIATHRQKQIEQGVNGKEFARVELRELKPIAARLQIDDAHTQRHCHHHQRHNGIGLHDVAQHFVGVNQIIYGDEVVANAKLLPEKIFAQRHHKQQQHINDPREIE